MHIPLVSQGLPLRSGLIGACRLAGAAWLMVLLVVAIACADDNACAYLAKHEVATVLGMAASDGEAQPANPMGQSTCFFPVSDNLPMRFAQLQMVRDEWAAHVSGRWTAASLFANNMGYLDNLREVTGLGEKAYWGGSGLKMGAGLHVLSQDAYFTVQVAIGSDDDNQIKARELATMVLHNLKDRP